MTVLERKKFKLIKAIINDTDEERVLEMEQMYKKPKKKQLPEPCMYTIEEIRESIRQQEEDLKAGRIKLIPHEEIKRKSIP